jgi:hypothetical protein
MGGVSNGNANSVTQGPQIAKRWAAVAGLWNFDGTEAVYHGPDDTSTTSPLGLAVCEQRFRDGQLSATVELSRNLNSSGGLLLGYQSADRGYFAATLGGHDRAYSISEFVPGRGWVVLTGAGNGKNLKPNSPYHLAVAVTGQTLNLSVDGVHVISHLLSRPIDGTGIGYFAWDDAEVRFENLTVEGRHPHIFVIMPFKEPYDTVYREVIEPVARREGYQVVPIDEVSGPGVILEDIQQQITRAHAVIAEVSNHNPNVFYELGYAHALGKPAVILVRRQDDTIMPFDIRGFRAVFYDDSIGGKHALERNLQEQLRAVLRGSLAALDVA